MGQEILHQHFSKSDFQEFSKKLKIETTLLKELFNSEQLSSHKPVGGFEIEACLIDSAYCPAPVNETFLAQFDNPLATSELAKFNIELNNLPHPLQNKVFTQFENDIHTVFKGADKAADKLSTRVLLTGILQTLTADDCCLKNMTNLKRYQALNNVVVNARKGRSVKLDISGVEDLKLNHDSVMLESATTSFQVHLQTPWQDAHHYYNASIIASAPLIAISGNSPYLFGKQLWHETRIPVFEQSVDTGDLQRVSFGSGFAKESIMECFDENLRDYPALLPMLFEDKPKKFKHLCLHNGVIWRWNRPLIGFDGPNNSGTTHIRIEQRILPAGPTIADMVANAAFFYGLTQSFMQQLKSGNIGSFEQAKANFYKSAKYGLHTTLDWRGKQIKAQQLILEEMLPLARSGLLELDIDKDEIEHYLNIIKQRAKTGQTGAEWQIQHVKIKNCNMAELTRDYLHHQHLDQPVHTWQH